MRERLERRVGFPVFTGIVRHSASPELRMPLAVERSDGVRIWLALCEGEEALLRSCGRARRATAVAECSPCCTHLRTTAASAAADAERAALACGVVEIDAAALGAVGG